MLGIQNRNIERHPLEPFAPANARLLLLGSFPPPQKRWCMNFFYPNFTNDMWRIFGLAFFGDREHFVDADRHTFRQTEIERLLTHKGIAIYDSACAVRRLRDNASDNFLEIVEQTDMDALLGRLPQLRAIAATGGKSAETLADIFAAARVPAAGESVPIEFDGRTLQLWRMPSSSRAYPMKLEKKAETYTTLFRELNML